MLPSYIVIRLYWHFVDSVFDTLLAGSNDYWDYLVLASGVLRL